MTTQKSCIDTCRQLLDLAENGHMESIAFAAVLMDGRPLSGHSDTTYATALLGTLDLAKAKVRVKILQAENSND